MYLKEDSAVTKHDGKAGQHVLISTLSRGKGAEAILQQRPVSWQIAMHGVTESRGSICSKRRHDGVNIFNTTHVDT